ncbi:MAG TPA: hypothetical protein VH083_01460 [Myxococcales bacterium]|jgi:hypothetical protein|nr:hypothetical protein [Myxococcales bacterium]
MTAEVQRDIFALDADVIIALRQLSLHEEITKTARWPVVVTDIVWSEVTATKAPGFDRGSLLLRSWAGSATELLPDTVEADALAALLARPGGAGAGESSIVAYALHHSEVVPVLRDGVAFRLAAEELPGRKLLGLHGLLQALMELNILSSILARKISSTYTRQNPGHHAPLWW